ncbi:MAG: hypothetical protein V4463_17860 [Pseudomonadota bacterium]
MRTLTIASFLAAFAVAGLAQAAPATNVDASATSVNVQGTRFKLSNEEFADFKGRYMLDDGHYVTLSSANKKFFAQYDDQASTEIVAVGRHEFVARNGDHLMFDEYRDGRVNDLVVARAK